VKKRPVKLDSALLYALAATLPFPLLGVPLNELYVLSLSSLFGLAFALLRVSRLGLRGLHWAALSMLLVFAATAVPRHAVTSYAISLGALGLALAPLTSPVSSEREIKALVAGLLVGLRLTILCVLISILIQVTGFAALAGGIASVFVRPEMGVFLGYVRPAAGFSEPAHLAIYLTSVFVALDLLRQANRYSGGLGPVVMGSIIFTGSLSGLVLFVAYLVWKLAFALRNSLVRGITSSVVMKVLASFTVLAVLIAFVGSNAFDFMDEYVVRIVQTREDIESLNLVGSEASRANAVRALPEYWESAGIPGFLFGTGYANYQGWLLSTYGDLGEGSTFARGQIDNILVAVFLSTGLIGFIAYFVFLIKAFGVRAIRFAFPAAIFVLAVNFAYGTLISSVYWSLLFVLASVARFSINCRARDTGLAGPRVPLRKSHDPHHP
jgi:hypothetical protein